MKKSIVVFAMFLAVFGRQSSVRAATCTPTGFFRDGINMTAVFINPASTLTGDVDATGCNIGVYFDSNGAVDSANIHGANYFGVLVNGDVNNVMVDVTNSSVHDIGEVPLNGSQHGVGIYYRAFGSGTVAGLVSGNTLWKYQKGGIVTNGLVTVTIADNVVTGEGPVAYIAQNGIQVGYGAVAGVKRNTVTRHSYTGDWGASSGGILVVGGLYYGGSYTVGTQVVGNTLVNNDVGVYLSNLSADYGAPATPTNIKVSNNLITNDAVTNHYIYQAGISDVGNNDKMINNTITGDGYNPTTVPGSTFWIDADTSFTNRPKVHANTIN